MDSPTKEFHMMTNAIATMLCSYAELLVEAEAFLGVQIDASGIGYAVRTDCEKAVMPTVRQLKENAAKFAGDWCHCSGVVVLAFVRVLQAWPREHAIGPVAPRDAFYVHGQSNLYISRRDDGTYHAVFSG